MLKLQSCKYLKEKCDLVALICNSVKNFSKKAINSLKRKERYLKGLKVRIRSRTKICLGDIRIVEDVKLRYLVYAGKNKRRQTGEKRPQADKDEESTSPVRPKPSRRTDGKRKPGQTGILFHVNFVTDKTVT